MGENWREATRGQTHGGVSAPCDPAVDGPVFFWSPRFDAPVADHRRFPYSKYRLLRERLLADEILSHKRLWQSPAAGVGEIERAHDPAYVHRVLTGALDAKELRRIGFRWSDEIPMRSRVSVGGGVASARAALRDGISGHLAGGTHHAHRDFGSGFCVFNDHAVAALTLMDEGVVDRISILDLDVHQGDGTAAILSGNERAIVVSVHGEKNFPFRKVPSHRDFPLPDGADDDAYLKACGQALEVVLAHRPDLLLYQAGVDALAEDRLGRLSVSAEGLARRDAMVFGATHARGVPVAMAIGGGYCDPIAPTVSAYCRTFAEAKRLYNF